MRRHLLDHEDRSIFGGILGIRLKGFLDIRSNKKILPFFGLDQVVLWLCFCENETFFFYSSIPFVFANLNSAIVSLLSRYKAIPMEEKQVDRV